MDPSRFVISDSRDPETIRDVTCALCEKVAVRPTECRNDHVFCYACIESHLATYPACPVDGAALQVSDLVINKFIERTVSRLLIRCENRDAGGATAMVGAIRKRLRHPVGCRWEGTVRQLNDHKNTCQFRCVPCYSCNRTDIPLIGMTAHLRECADRYTKCNMCDAEVVLRAMADHIESCPAASVYCPNHCLIRPGETTDVRMLQRKDIEAHMTNCPQQVVDCEYRDLGCEFRCRRELMFRHMETALQQHVSIVRSGLVEVRNYLGLKAKIESLDDKNAPMAPRPSVEADGVMTRIEDAWDAQPLSGERSS